MKYFIHIVIILIVVGSLWFVLHKNEAPSYSEGKIKWIFHFKDGLEIAKINQKPVLVFFTASWCYWCRKLNNDVFMNDDVAHLANSFVNILIDVDSQPDLIKIFGVRGVPDIYFMDFSRKKIIQYNGNRTAEDMVHQMRSSLKSFDL